MNKKSQLYLLAALIIGFILFVLITPSNVVKKTVIESQFKEISKNFERESVQFLNTVISDDRDVADEFLSFTILFTSYSKTRNPDFGLLYAFIYQDKLYMGNYLSDTVHFSFEDHTYQLPGCFDDVKTTFSIAGLDISISDVDLVDFLPCQTIADVRGLEPYELGVKIFEDVPVNFNLELVHGNPEFVLVTREKKEDVRQVYTKGKFI